jgi:hypothetical protein
MMKENWERKLFYLLTPALMGDPFQAAQPVGLSEPSAVRGATLAILGYASEQGAN